MLNSVSPGSLLLTFLIVLILFGTKKLRSIGEDLGHAVRGFRKALNGETNPGESDNITKQD